MTIENLSIDTGIPLGSLCVYESGKRNPSRKRLKSIAFEFNVDWKILDPDETPVFLPDDFKENIPSCPLCNNLDDRFKRLAEKYKALDEGLQLEALPKINKILDNPNCEIILKDDAQKKCAHEKAC